MTDLTLQQSLTNALQAIFTEKFLTLNYPLNPKTTSILLWKNTNPKSPNSFILKIGEQRFIGLPRSDKNNEVYWKIRDFSEDKNPESNNSETSSSSANLTTDALAKFQQRQAKTEQINIYGNNHKSEQPAQ